MALLDPATAAILANRVYDVLSTDQWNRIVASRGSAAGSMGFGGFTGDPQRIMGASGGRFTGATTGFGFIAMGEGPRQGEVLVALRGTASLADGITDANCSFARSPGGYVVHNGFALTHRSLQEEIGAYFRKAGRNPSVVHVLGHSLGGGLATLAAEQLAMGGMGVALYTFGCPRVGDSTYAEAMSSMIGAGNIHRVYHEADPVSMVPIYPFVPMPPKTRGHCLPWNGWKIALKAHSMENYISSVSDCSWNSLPAAETTDFFGAADKWLSDIADGSGTVTMLSTKALRMIMRALRWILDQILTAGSAIGQFAAAGAVMVVDVLSYVLYSGVLASAAISRYVSSLLSGMMQFMGRTMTAGQNVSAAFIRWVLNLFVGTITPMARRVLLSTFG